MINSVIPTQINITTDNIEFLGFKGDKVGRIFTWDNRIFRGIYKDYADNINELLNSGLIEELTRKKLFPETKITDINFPGFELVLEHEKVVAPNYPFEWSFNMLRDAGVALLKVADIARKYNYEVKDGHSFNIMFNYTQPMFIDLGSFSKVKPGYKGWIAYPEFIKFFYFSLKLWPKNPHLAKRISYFPTYMVPHYSYMLYFNPLSRLIPIDTLQSLIELYYKTRTTAPLSKEEIEQEVSGKPKKVLILLKKLGLLPWQEINFEKLIRKLNKLPSPRSSSMWKEYHTQYYNKDGTLKSTPRFDRIIEIIKSLSINNITEIAGNQGIFSRLIIERTNVQNINCTDYDENAIDKQYNTIKNLNLPITPVVLDFRYPSYFNYTQPTEERFKSDAVLALALTHHLILTQHVPLDEIFLLLKKYARKYVFVEFMPMGLFDGKKSPPMPQWYNIEWFRETFNNSFKLLFEEKLEENRVLFVGEII